MASAKLRAIDLYSGVGGWSLGFRLAGIDVVASYEYWEPANETNFKNNLHQPQTVDIRGLAFEDLPEDIDIVVGSPPCTQFSFSNRGGNGDIDEGLKDIIKFLTIVDHLRPKAWAMENVPRVAKIIEQELCPEGRLHQFAHLGVTPHVVNMEDYGLPQRRRRCIAGNFAFDLLQSYSAKTRRRTLGEVVEALAADSVVDPIYGVSLPRDQLFDHVPEAPLNDEETRINRAGKVTHRVYNSMPFPDRLDRSVRTITATCLRVSRQSIVIAAPGAINGYRRLTVRERACLQGFPINFQFYGENYSQKLRMIGNAIPPAFSYYVAQAFKGIAADKLPTLAGNANGLVAPSPPPAETHPDRPGARYPHRRTFRFAIPSLRLKSGVRFELVNKFEAGHPGWEVAFYFGTSKSIQSLRLDATLNDQLMAALAPVVAEAVVDPLGTLATFIGQADIAHMQTLWSHRGIGRTRAFMVLDELDHAGEAVVAALGSHSEAARNLIMAAIEGEHADAAGQLPGLAKLARNAPLILAGLLVGSLANPELAKHAVPDMPQAFRRVSN